MDDDRLPTELFVTAHLRQMSAAGVPCVVARRGDPHGGMLVIKINQLEAGCRVLSQTRDLDGSLAWMAAFDGAPVPEEEADAYIARATGRDPDLWVVEIESRDGSHPFEGKLL